MKDKFHIIQFIVFLIAQVSVAGFTNFGPILFICFYPLFIITYTPNTATIRRMLVAFLLGLFIDGFSNGIIGINAASATLLAFVAPFTRTLICGRTEYDRDKRIGLNELGIRNFTIYVVVSMAIFQLYYFFLESFDLFFSIDDVIRFFISLIINTFIIILIELSLFSKKF